MFVIHFGLPKLLSAQHSCANASFFPHFLHYNFAGFRQRSAVDTGRRRAYRLAQGIDQNRKLGSNL